MATGLENLIIYKMASDLEIEVNEITKQFPKEEKFRSVDQLNRSSSSVPNNIAEAYHKKSIKDKLRILNDIAKCEAEETKRNLLQCARKNFAEPIKLTELAEKYTGLIKAINGYIRFLRNITNKST